LEVPLSRKINGTKITTNASTVFHPSQPMSQQLLSKKKNNDSATTITDMVSPALLNIEE
jgi:hypothetical protein